MPDCVMERKSKMKKYDNPMSRQVESLPELMEQQYDDLEPKTRKVLSFQEIYNIQRIILTGCGIPWQLQWLQSMLLKC